MYRLWNSDETILVRVCRGALQKWICQRRTKLFLPQRLKLVSSTVLIGTNLTSKALQYDTRLRGITQFLTLNDLERQLTALSSELCVL